MAESGNDVSKWTSVSVDSDEEVSEVYSMLIVSAEFPSSSSTMMSESKESSTYDSLGEGSVLGL